MREVYAYWAEKWLEEKLLPLALACAGLSPDTSPEALQGLDLPKILSDEFTSYDQTKASLACTDCAFFGAVLLAKELAASEPAKNIADWIHGLIWRDALESKFHGLGFRRWCWRTVRSRRRVARAPRAQDR